MTNRLRICDAEGNLLCSLPNVVLPDIEVLTFALKSAFPILQTTPFAISFLGTDNVWTPYSPETLPPRCRKLSIHGQGNYSDVIADCVLQQADRNHMRSRDDAKGLQAAMRAHCMRRDQCCVLSGRCEDVVLKCSHVLTPEYGAKWFAEELDRRDFLCYFPTVAGRYLPAFDIKNGVIMSADLHESSDAFRFSIWPRDNKFFVHLFYPVTGLRHGQEVTVPHILPNGPTPNYFRDLFPEPEVFLAHFAQAVLFNMRGAGEAYIPSNDSGEDTDDDIFANLSEDLQFHWWDSEQELARKIVRRDQLRRSCDTLYQYEVERA